MTNANNKIKKAMEIVNNYRDYAINNDCYIKPTKGTNSGSDGRLFEGAVKVCINNYSFKNLVASKGRIDTTKRINGKMCKFEIKSGCGTLATLNKDGSIRNSELLKSDYVIYAAEYFNQYPVCEQAYIFPVQVFLFILEQCGLLRYKYSGEQYTTDTNGKKIRKANAYHDRLTIQTFNNSKKKKIEFNEMIVNYGTRLDIFCRENNIKYNTEI